MFEELQGQYNGVIFKIEDAIKKSLDDLDVVYDAGDVFDILTVLEFNEKDIREQVIKYIWG